MEHYNTVLFILKELIFTVFGLIIEKAKSKSAHVSISSKGIL